MQTSSDKTIVEICKKYGKEIEPGERLEEAHAKIRKVLEHLDYCLSDMVKFLEFQIHMAVSKGIAGDEAYKNSLEYLKIIKNRGF